MITVAELGRHLASLDLRDVRIVSSPTSEHGRVWTVQAEHRGEQIHHTDSQLESAVIGLIGVASNRAYAANKKNSSER